MGAVSGLARLWGAVASFYTSGTTANLATDEQGNLRTVAEVGDQCGKSVAIGAGSNSLVITAPSMPSPATPGALPPTWVNGAGSVLVGSALAITVGGVAVTVTFGAGNCASQVALLAALNAATGAGTPGFGAGVASVNNAGQLCLNFGVTTATVTAVPATTVMVVTGPNGLVSGTSTPIVGKSAAQYAGDVYPGLQPRTVQVVNQSTFLTPGAALAAGASPVPVPVFRGLLSPGGGSVWIVDAGAMPFYSSISVVTPVIARQITLTAGVLWAFDEVALVIPNASNATDLVGVF
jgi:hypothetical protein